MGERGPKQRKSQPWEKAFLANFRKTYSVTEAAETHGNPARGLLEVGRSSRTVNRWRKKSKRFNRQVNDIWGEIRESLEASAMRKAIHGWLEPVYYKGEIVGSRPVFSPGLTIFMLKAHLPDRYREQRGDGEGSSAAELADEIRRAIASGVSAIPSEDGADEPTTIDAESSPATGTPEGGGVPGA